MCNKYKLYIYARGPVSSVIYDNESLGKRLLLKQLLLG